MKKTDSKYVYIAICIVFVVAIIIIGVSLTYAFYEGSVEGNTTETHVKSSGNPFDISSSLETENAIEAYNLYPIDESQVVFAPGLKFTASPKATNTSNGAFDIYLSDIAISTNFISSDFKWKLLMDDEVIASGSFADIQTNGVSSTSKTDTEKIKYFDKYNLKVGQTFNGNNESQFEVKVYLANTSANQNNLENGSFESKVNITGYSR